MEKWPENEKGIWQSLYPGQKWAAILGLIIIPEMLRSCLFLLHPIGLPKFIEMVIFFILAPFVALVYANGVGFAIALVIQILFYKR